MRKNKNKSTIIYARVSSDEQVDNYSLGYQIKTGNDFCILKDFKNVIEVIDDGFSGKSLKRPGIKKVLSMIDSDEVENIIFTDLDRLTRNSRDGYNIIDRCILYKVALYGTGEKIKADTADDRLVLRFKFALAQHTSEKISEKTITGLIGGLTEGNYIFPKAPFGYSKSIVKKDIVDPVERKRAKITLRPVEDEILIIKAIYELYAVQEKSIREISMIIEKRYKMIVKQSKIAKILRDEKYTGSFKYRDKIYNNMGLEEIITKEVFNLVQARLTKNFKIKKYSYIFYNKVQCNCCGSFLICKPTRKKTKNGIKVYQYYQCDDKECEKYNKRINQISLLKNKEKEIVKIHNLHKAAFLHSAHKTIRTTKSLSEQELKSVIANYMKPFKIDLT